MYYYYLDQSKKDMPYFDPDVDHAVTYEGVKQMILSKANVSPVFFKDMSYYVTSELENDTEFNQQMTHCFLIRNPMASIASYYALDNNLTLKEIGIEAQWRQYEHLVEMGIKPVVIKAESVRQNPQAYTARWWDSIGLDYKAKAFDWNEEYPASWESVKTWHSIYENPDDFARVSELLAPYANVVLLLPPPDIDESISILKDRHATTINGVEITEYLVSHPSSTELADYTVFTENRTSSEIMNEILTEVEVTPNTNFWSRLLRR